MIEASLGLRHENDTSHRYYPTSISDTLIIYHNGHETGSCIPNYDGVVDHFNELGYDVMEMMSESRNDRRDNGLLVPFLVHEPTPATHKFLWCELN